MVSWNYKNARSYDKMRKHIPYAVVFILANYIYQVIPFVGEYDWVAATERSWVQITLFLWLWYIDSRKPENF